MLRNKNLAIIMIIAVTMVLVTTSIISITTRTTINEYQVFAKSNKNTDYTIIPDDSNSGTTTKTTIANDRAGLSEGGNNQVTIVGIKHLKSFNPNPINIKVGDRVAWTNNHREGHTVTSKTSEFDSGDIAPGQSFNHTFDK